jgi:hypothetical protein
MPARHFVGSGGSGSRLCASVPFPWLDQQPALLSWNIAGSQCRCLVVLAAVLGWVQAGVACTCANHMRQRHQQTTPSPSHQNFMRCALPLLACCTYCSLHAPIWQAALCVVLDWGFMRHCLTLGDVGCRHTCPEEESHDLPLCEMTCRITLLLCSHRDMGYAHVCRMLL